MTLIYSGRFPIFEIKILYLAPFFEVFQGLICKSVQLSRTGIILLMRSPLIGSGQPIVGWVRRLDLAIAGAQWVRYGELGGWR
ncbi:MAG: hypothetical protein MH252_15870 [Thermosynechococcaceae cyanobacterium MS004]|nr:hypothetical protein [Thermosynechococcaceae cyanobacterium MS004]